MSEFEGLCDGDHWDFHKVPDHWKGSYTRGSSKGRVTLSWNHVSASQIENFTKCPRYWHFKSILKIPETQKGHQSLGEAFHLVMERVPQGLGWPSRSDVAASPEDWDKADAMAKLALPLMPGVNPNNILDITQISTEIKREHGIRMSTYDGGPTMVGYIDLGMPVGIGWPALIIPSSEAIVADYKTTSDFRYMKTPQELADSIQMMTYAKWALGEDGDYLTGLRGEDGLQPDHVRLVHLYARTKAPFTRASIRHETAVVSADEINSRWEKTLDTVREMSQIALCDNSDDVEARGALNGHCEAYGGCTFRDKCGIAKSSGIKSIFQISKKPAPSPTQENQTMAGSSILEKIKQAQAKAAASNTSASPGTVVNPSDNSGNQPAGKPISGLIQKILLQGKGKPTLSGPLAQAYGQEIGQPLVTILGDGKLQATTLTTLGELVQLASGILPPDAPSRSQEIITRPGEAPPVVESNQNAEDDEDSEDGGISDGSNVSGAAVTGPVADPSGVVADAPKRRGRPSNAELEARKAQEHAAFEALVQAEVQKRLGSTNTPIASGDLDQRLQAKIDELAAEAALAQSDLQDAHSLIRTLRGERDQASSSTPVQEGLTLYVDCFPTKGDREVVDFFEWIGPICAKVAQNNSVNDWRLINYTAKGLLAAAIRETVREHGVPKALTVSTYAGGADIALEVLTPIAKRVIKKI